MSKQRGNPSIVLARRPEGTASAEDFALVEQAIPQPGPGQLLVRTQVLSLDPYMASAIQGRHMSGAVAVGGVMPGEVVGVVQESRHPDFAEGDQVLVRGGWRSYCLAEGAEPTAQGMGAILSPVARHIPPSPGIPASAWLGVLGMPGLTAFAVMLRTLRPLPGDTALIFAATGAVGSVAGQIARRMGARAVAFVGTQDKARHACDVLGFDDAIVRKAADLPTQLSRACPDRIDALMTNDCGPGLGMLLGHLALGARIALIGNMSQYNSAQILPGPELGQVIAQRATMTGFVVYDHYDLMERWQRTAQDWINEGSLHFHEDRTIGLAQAPAAFARLMRGETMGKTLVVLED